MIEEVYKCSRQANRYLFKKRKGEYNKVKWLNNYSIKIRYLTNSTYQEQ